MSALTKMATIFDQKLIPAAYSQREQQSTAARIATGPSRQASANVNVQDDKGITPLYLACRRGHERVVRALLNAGADPDLVDSRGKAPQVGFGSCTPPLLYCCRIPPSYLGVSHRSPSIVAFTRSTDNPKRYKVTLYP